MILIRQEFTNELGRKITIEVRSDVEGVTVNAASDNSLVEQTWTPVEARVLREMFQMLEPGYVPLSKTNSGHFK